MSRFYIGQKVVCINDNAGRISGEKLLEKKRIYEIVSFLGEDIGVRGVYGHWDSNRFNPVASTESESFSESLIKELETEINEENLILK